MSSTPHRFTLGSLVVVALAGCGPSAGAPSILNQPRGITAVAGTPASFVVLADGDALTYQWTREAACLIAGATYNS